MSGGYKEFDDTKFDQFIFELDGGAKSPPIVPFYEKFNPLFSLTNFSFDPVTIDNKTYNQTEIYFQREKFAHDENLLTQFDAAVFSATDALNFARMHSDKIITNWHQKKKEVMKKALQAKIDTHPYIKEMLLATGNACLVEDTTSSEFEEKIWGWGSKDGENLLGICWMELRDKLLYPNETPTSNYKTPEQLYKEVQEARQQILPKLKYDAANTLDTKKPYYCLQKLQEQNKLYIKKQEETINYKTAVSPAVSTPARAVTNTATYRVKEAIGAKKEIDKIEITPNMEKTGHVLKIKFNNKQAAENFKNNNQQLCNQNIQANRAKQHVVILTKENAEKFFTEKRIETHGRTANHTMWNALLYEQNSLPSRDYYPPEEKTPTTAAAKTPNNNTLESLKNKIVDAKDLKFKKNTDSLKQQVLQITFEDEAKAKKFAEELKNIFGYPIKTHGTNIFLVEKDVLKFLHNKNLSPKFWYDNCPIPTPDPALTNPSPQEPSAPELDKLTPDYIQKYYSDYFKNNTEITCKTDKIIQKKDTDTDTIIANISGAHIECPIIDQDKKLLDPQVDAFMAFLTLQQNSCNGQQVTIRIDNFSKEQLTQLLEAYKGKKDELSSINLTLPENATEVLKTALEEVNKKTTKSPGP